MTVRQLHLPAERSAAPRWGAEVACFLARKRTWQHVKKDGTVIYVEVARSAVDFAGESACLVIANDVSEGKRSELLYRMLMDTIPSSVLLLDENLCVVLANRNFLEKSRQTTGVTAGKRLAEVFPEVILAEMGLEQQIRNVFTKQPCDARPEADLPGARRSDSGLLLQRCPGELGRASRSRSASHGRCHRADAAGRRDPADGAPSGQRCRERQRYCHLHRYRGQYPDLEQGGSKDYRLLARGVERPPVFRLLRPDRRRRRQDVALQRGVRRAVPAESNPT